jgi:CheY-like chemotaxis protein
LAAPQDEPAARSSKERVLIVDDNADMRDYLCQLLRDWDVTTATNGATALEQARANPPHLVITDVMMPELDGFGLLRELRRDLEPGCSRSDGVGTCR